MNRNLRELPLHSVQVKDAFWSARQNTIIDVTIPYMEEVLNDRIEGIDRSHAIENFRAAAGESDEAFYGMVFQDSDVYKWIEATAYALMVRPDAALEKRLDDVIALLGRAQQPDGYLNTYFTLKDEPRFSNLLECHELYCAGHLLEAAVACYEALGKRELLEIGEKLCACLMKQFEEDGIPGHQEIEIGLLRMYHVTGKKEYLDLCMKFLDRRGTDPDWFVRHTPAHPGISYGGYDIDPADTEYNQSYAPVRTQKDVRGHAVRMVYMLTAMADAAGRTGDEALLSACRAMIDNMETRRMYLTGGLGARAAHESFGGDFELPNDRGYNETCASVACVFLMEKMLLHGADGRYADLMERQLYNGALAGMQLDGRRFFYVNPLEVDPQRAGVEEDVKHVLPQRPPWYPCACCPPNLARLITSLGRILWMESDDTLYANLFIGSTAETAHGRITLETGYPWRGAAKYTFESAADTPFTLAIHIPGYVKAEALSITVNAEKAEGEIRGGYLYLNRNWQAGDQVCLSFDMQPVFVMGDARVEGNRGCAAVMRGPLVYCFEQADHALPLEKLMIDPSGSIKAEPYKVSMLGGVTPLKVSGTDEQGNSVELTAIPYYSWANRSKGAMRVWLPAVKG